MCDLKKFEGDIEKYLIFLEMEKGLSENTIISYKQELEKFSTYLKTNKLNYIKLSETNVINFIKFESAKGNSLSTQAHLISVLKSFYRYLINEEKIDYNPVSNISFPKKWKILPKYLTVDQVFELLIIPDVKTPMGSRDKAILKNI